MNENYESLIIGNEQVEIHKFSGIYSIRVIQVTLAQFTLTIVGKVVIPLLSKIPPFLEIHVPTFHRFFAKTKVLNNSCNQFVSNFCPHSVLVLEECSRKW